MYAIVEIGGHQFKIEKNQKIYVNRLESEEGSNVEFDNVLLLADGDNIKVGKPSLEGAKVKAKVLEHLKGDKVEIFKKKKRKGYQTLNGHRQQLSQIQIEELIA